MKAKLIFLFFLLTTTISFGQKVTLQELMALCGKSNWDQVNEYLLKKGWDYHESSKGDDEHYSTITWSFDKDFNSDKAKGWIYLYTYQGSPSKISYNFFNKDAYNIVKSGFAASEMKLIDNSIEDDEIVTKYSGKGYIVTVRTAKQERKDDFYDNSTTITSYLITLVKKAGIYDNENGPKKKL